MQLLLIMHGTKRFAKISISSDILVWQWRLVSLMQMCFQTSCYHHDTTGQENIDQLHILSEKTIDANATATSDKLLPLVSYCKKLFGACPDHDNSALATLERKIQKMKSSNQTAEGIEVSFLEKTHMMHALQMRSTNTSKCAFL